MAAVEQLVDAATFCRDSGGYFVFHRRVHAMDVSVDGPTAQVRVTRAQQAEHEEAGPDEVRLNTKEQKVSRAAFEPTASLGASWCHFRDGSSWGGGYGIELCGR